MVINLEIQKNEQNQKLQNAVNVTNASDITSPKPINMGEGLNTEDEATVIYETAADIEQNVNESRNE